uniref:Uncharacterized protein n=1 Tax=Peronospora matthiolae TaxID=2874970 RepID=A0AAV1U086_9STRA
MGGARGSMYSPVRFGELTHPVVLDGGMVLLGRRCAQQRRHEDFTRHRREAV